MPLSLSISLPNSLHQFPRSFSADVAKTRPDAKMTPKMDHSHLSVLSVLRHYFSCNADRCLLYIILLLERQTLYTSMWNHVELLFDIIYFVHFYWIRLFIHDTNKCAFDIQGDSNWWTQLNSKRRHTPDNWLRYSNFCARSTGWLAWAMLKTLLNSSHVLFSYTQKILCCIVAILFSTDVAARLCARRAL